MKTFLFSLLFITGCLAAGAQCAAPVITTSGSTSFCSGGSVTLSTPNASNTWTQKANLGVNKSSAVSFSIGSKGYIGVGYNGTSRQKDFWEYDPATNAWTQKADFGGAARTQSLGFSIGSKGYIGTGNTAGGFVKDFWEYDPAANAWAQKMDFGGSERVAATGLSIGGKGYIGTGFNGSILYKDFWEYDPGTNTWAQKANFGGSARSDATSFSIGTRGYIGTGYDNSDRNDFWEYNPVTNSWAQKADFGGLARNSAVGFGIGTKGYIGTGNDGNIGYLKDFWEYNPVTNSWAQKADFGGSARFSAVGFSIGSKGYVGTGYDGSNLKSFYEYSPNNTYSWSPGGQTTSAITVSATGNYTVTATSVTGCSATSVATTITVSTPVAPVITASGSTTICSGGSVTLSGPDGNTWTQKADFGGTARYAATGFSIGNKGYIGTGYGGSSKKDFWEYDPVTGAWTQKADFGGVARVYAIGFSIGSKGYIGTGQDGTVHKKDFWEYDPAGNIWTQKADFGGAARYDATGFSIGSKGYIGTGYDDIAYKKDFWEYDPAGNIWTQKADFAGTARYSATGFSIGSKGYIGTGQDGILNYKKDFWEYDPAGNTWTQKADLGGSARAYATGFSIGSKGYIGTGINSNYKKDFWEYDPAGNTWMQKADFGGTARFGVTGFSIGDKGYISAGAYTNGITKDFWEYDPGYTYAWSPGGQTTPSITVYASGNYSLTITNAFGCSATSAVIPVKAFPAGTVYVDGNKATSGDGSGWATAYTSLQEALYAANLCSSITTINVAKGTYKPVNNADRNSTFLITRGGLKIYGGYPSGGAGVRNAFANPTILSGDVGSSAIFDNSYHIMVIAGLSNTADSVVVDGFTITGGAATGAGSAIYNGIALDRNHGAAIDAEQNGSGKLAFRNLIIANNIGSDGWGAAMVLNTSGAILDKCIFYGNSASGTGQGGALWNNSSSTTMNNCLLYNNYGAGLGGAIQLNGSNPLTVNNTTFYANRTGGNGGAIRSGAGSVLNINNTIFYKNDIGAASGTYVAPGNDLTLVGSSAITNTMLQGSAATYSSATNSVFGAAPLFVNEANPAGTDGIFGTADDGLLLQGCSPAINSGSNAASSIQATDMANQNRIYNSTIDMGAYEYQAIADGSSLAVNGDNRSYNIQAGANALLIPGCRIIAHLLPNGTNPVNGSLSAKVWVDATQPVYNGKTYLKRHFELTPAVNAATSSARITLYATQEELNAFNSSPFNGNSLPTGPNDFSGIANLRIVKFNGQSSNSTGLPGTYGGAGMEIDPDDNNIVWNNSLQRWEITFNVTGFSGFFITNNSGILPLTLLQFKGTVVNSKDALLNWRTANEVNTSHFELQRSPDGRSFSTIATIQAKGTAQSQTDYSYTDKNMPAGLYYYRLHMVDKDGRETYSAVVMVVLKSSNAITLYPVPAKDVLWLGGSAANQTAKTALLIDVQGRILQSIRINQWPQKINVSALAPGTYLIKVEGKESMPFIKE